MRQAQKRRDGNRQETAACEGHGFSPANVGMPPKVRKIVVKVTKLRQFLLSLESQFCAIRVCEIPGAVLGGLGLV